MFLTKHFLSVVLILLSWNSWATPKILLLESEEKSKFGKYTSIFIDSSGRLAMEDIIKLEKEFIPCQYDIFSYGPSKNTFWVKFNINNQTIHNDYYLLIDNPYLEEIELYSIESNKVQCLAKTGLNYPFSRRQIERSTFIFKINLPYKVEQTFYIKYRSVRPELPLIIGTNSKIQKYSQSSDLKWAIHLGIFLTVIAYHFFLFLIIKERCYLYFALYFFFLFIFSMLVKGYAFQYFYPNIPQLNAWLLSCNGIAVFFFILFGVAFLNIQKYSSLLYKICVIFLALILISTLLNFFNSTLYIKVINILTFLTSPFFIISAIHIYRKGFKPARYFLIACTLFLIAILFNTLRLLGIIPYTDLTANIILYGIASNAILLSIGLGERYSEYRREKEAVQKELEMKIIEKTKSQYKLKKLNKTLRKANADLDKFIYTASHDLKSPILNIEGLINALHASIEKDKESLKIYDMILESINKFKETIINLEESSKVNKMKKESLDEINISESINEVLFNLNTTIQKSEAKVKTEFTKSPILVFPKRYFIQIMETLVSNSLKFKSPDRLPEITIESHKTSDYVVICVTDNGLGIKKEYQNKIFNIFTKAHSKIKGKGIELYTLKHIMEIYDGKIELSSEVNNGSTFRLFFKNNVV